MKKQSPISPRREEVPFVVKNLKQGNVLNIGGAIGDWKGRLIREGRSMTVIDVMAQESVIDVVAFIN